MKMTRDQLKGLIKECLVEILAEGLGDNIQEARRRPAQQRTVPPRQTGQMRQIMEQNRPRQKDPYLDSPVPRPAIQEAVREVASAIKDPIMASIFADTAQTTLVNQAAAGHAREGGAPPPGMLGDAAQRMAAAVEPEQLFGQETVQQWNEAAFAPARNAMPGQRRAPAAPPLDYDPYAPNPEIKPA